MKRVKFILLVSLLFHIPVIGFGQFDDTLQTVVYSEYDKARFLGQKALDLFDSGDLDQSLSISKTALASYRELGIHDLEAQLLLNIGMIYRIQGDYQQALKYLYASVEQSKNLELYNDQAAALNQIGTIYRLQGNSSGALEHYFNALTLFQKLEDLGGIATILNNIGIVYFYQGNFEKSLEYYLASLELEEERQDEYGISISYINIGEVYKNLKQYDEALSYFLKALVLAQKNEDKDLDGDSVGVLYNEIGSIYCLKGNYSLSQNYLKKAEAIFLQINNRQRLAESRIYLADLSLKTNGVEQAKAYLYTALSDAESISALTLIVTAHHNLSQIFETQHLVSKAFDHYKKYITTRDSIFNEDQMKRIVQTEMLYQFDREMQQAKFEQEKSDIQLQERIRRQRLVRNFQYFALLLLLIGSIYIYAAYRHKQRINLQLNRQHVQILQKNKELLQHHEEIRANRDEIEKKNISLEESQRIIEAKNDSIISSIEYAQTIQQAILPVTEDLVAHLPYHFIYFKPKDIVSGDFYWFSALENLLIIAVVDCTGHGVPGAFMSLIGYTLFNQIVNEKKVTDPAQILKWMHEQIREVLNQNAGGSKAHASMEICLVVADKETNELTFAGAGLPLFVVENGEAFIKRGNIYSAGGFQREKQRVFTNQTIPITPGMCIYLTTDGYLDQMNPASNKYGRRRFLKLIEAINEMPSDDKAECIHKAFEEHRQKHDQIDDVCILGICFK